jgi:FecR protein
MTIVKLGKTMAFWAVLMAFLAVSASAESKARIVRLSDVQGSAQMDRGNGDGFEKAYLNMPIIEGAKLKTGSNGKAEIEFEDGSVMHVVPDSQLVFTHLGLGDDGQKLTTVELAEGTAYVNVRAKKGDRFTLNFVRESVTVTEPVHFRVELSNAEATVAVFQGDLQVAGPSGQVEIGKKHSATFDLANNDSYALAKNFEEDPYDDWDKQQNETHDRYASGGRDIQSPYAYGMSDLNYYGSYMNIPGYGMGWQPYFIGAGWSPFQDGGWAYYPGSGYMWVSAYPWGWMPYRYGSWNFVPGYGWVWMPGNNWNTWYPVTPIVNPPKRTQVVTPPVRGRTTVMVGQGLSVNPPVGVPRRIMIAPGSAGLGVPRGSVHNLDRLSHETIKTEQAVQVRTVQPPVHFERRESPSYSGGGSRTSAPSAPPVRSAPPSSGPVKH